MRDATTWLVGEVVDLLDAGPVGLYEFIWLLRGSDLIATLSDEQVQSRAAAALTVLIENGEGSLVWLDWPLLNRVDGPLPLVGPGAISWADPAAGQPYLAIERVSR